MKIDIEQATSDGAKQSNGKSTSVQIQDGKTITFADVMKLVAEQNGQSEKFWLRAAHNTGRKMWFHSPAISWQSASPSSQVASSVISIRVYLPGE